MAQAQTSSFGEHLRRLRESAGITQEELAERASLSRDAVSALERGHRRHPHPETLRALATALGLTAAETDELRAIAPRRSPGGTAAAPAHRVAVIPLPLTHLVGRRRELAELRSLLTVGGARLVTLTGPAGVGKTRLALEIAQQLRGVRPGDIAFVSLATILDPALVLPTIAEALGIREAGGRPLIDQLSQALCDRATLLILDNLEHLAGAATPIAELLAACPAVAILATSRAPLRLSGEHEYPVLPFGILPPSQPDALLQVIDNDAVTLFVQRARAVRPEFTLTDTNSAPITEICARLDGLPLAIELAAARIKFLSPEALLARLGSRLALLSGGPQDHAPRQQSMRAAIAWSYELLTPAEQLLFRQLAVFTETFTLDAAKAVVSAGKTDAPSDHAVLDGVVSLVDKSLVHRLDSDEPEPRFGMLATIQEYGEEQLAAHRGTDAARRAHADYFLELADQAAQAFRRRTDQEPWLNRLELERGNLRTALAWLDASGDETSLLRLAGALHWFWYIRGPLGEGRSWLNRALAISPGRAPVALLARALVGAALLAHFQEDDDPAQRWLHDSIARAAEVNDPWLVAFALLLLGLIEEDHGDYADAESHFADALTHFRLAWDWTNVALCLIHLGVATWGQGDPARATALCEEALALQRGSGDDWGIAVSLGYLGLLASVRGEYAAAAESHRESLELRWDGRAWEDVAACFSDLAVVAAGVNRPEQAARFLGVASAMREDIGRLSPKLPERALFEQAEQQARATLGEKFNAAFASGRALAPEAAVTEALAFASEIAADP